MTQTARQRVFFGIELPDEVRHRLAVQLEHPVRRRALPGRRVPPDNWHLTLRFIGLAGEAECDRMLAALDEAELGGPFRLALGGLGAFPKPAKAAVVWLGVTSGSERLTELAERCEDAAVAVGFPAEDRPFHPHVTLSRVRPPGDVRSLVADYEARAAFEVTAVTLFRSVQQHRRPNRYEVLETVAL